MLDEHAQAFRSESQPAMIQRLRDDLDQMMALFEGLSDEDWTGFLLNQGADPNLAGKGGDTPLIAASRIGFDQAVEWLLGMGAKVDLANKMGETPLIVAVQQRQAPIVRRLLESIEKR